MTKKASKGLFELVVAILVFVLVLAVETSPLPAGRMTAVRLGVKRPTIQPIDLSQLGQKILVFAPHPDDETLGAGGLIYDAIKRGKQVKVVVMTNGDCFATGAEVEFKRLRLASPAYVKYGSMRQEEALRAVNVLGLNRRDMVFLGFPDRGLSAIWLGYWGNSPYRSRCTGVRAVPYLGAYRTGAPYTAPELLSELVSVIRDFRPDTVIVTDSADVHPDHWATFNFVSTALFEAYAEEPRPSYKLLTYIVHSGYWQSMPVIAHEYRTLLPPKYFLTEGYDWLSLELSTAARTAKRRAITQYRTQQLVIPALLQNFQRPNELLNKVNIPSVKADLSDTATTVSGNCWQTADPIGYDPRGDTRFKVIDHGADFLKLYWVGCRDGLPAVTFHNAGSISSDYSFGFYIVCFSKSGILMRESAAVKLSGTEPTFSSSSGLVQSVQVEGNTITLSLKLPKETVYAGISAASYYRGSRADVFPWHFVSVAP
ncbi:PIG-L family deacetylase [Coprothermobacteraceae bacterium]|nr:PIG-L family deacetylase [Coprothermobacteraceae bacterium]